MSVLKGIIGKIAWEIALENCFGNLLQLNWIRSCAAVLEVWVFFKILHVTIYSYSLNEMASCPRCGLPLCRECCESETPFYKHSQECQIFSKIREERPEAIAGLVTSIIFFWLLWLCVWAERHIFPKAVQWKLDLAENSVTELLSVKTRFSAISSGLTLPCWIQATWLLFGTFLAG